MKNKLEIYAEKLGCGGLILALILAFGLLFGIDCLIVWGCMALWNACLVGAVPILAQVSYWQMWGIYLLCTFLFKARVVQNALED